MATTDITGLPAAVAIDGSEKGVCVQGGATKQFDLALLSSVQFNLDSISSTQGAVLYRNASDWVALAPGTSGYVLTTGGAAANPSWVANGTGTVSSVAMSVPSFLSVAGSPITTTGTLAVSLANQSSNTGFLGPTNGAAAAPTFRTFVNADIAAAGAALTRTDDTNVTVTLGGAASTAMVNAASLTLGWTGTLSPARGGMGVANNAASTLTISGNFASTFTMTGITSVTFPTTGVLATTAGASIPAVVQGDLLYGSASNVLSALTKNASATRYLSNTGTSNNPAWAQVNLSNGVTGLLGYTNLDPSVANAIPANFAYFFGASGNVTASGQNLAGLGYNTLVANTSGSGNTGVGSLALQSNLSGNSLSAVGYRALRDNTTGSGNSAVGDSAMMENLTGTGNCALGDISLTNNHDGDNNTAVGYASMHENDTGSENAAFGGAAMYNNLADQNTAIGYNAMYYNTSGIRLAAGGHSALLRTATSNDNTGFGFAALQEALGGSNTGLGSRAGLSLTTGIESVFIGKDAGNSVSQLVSADNSIAIGTSTFTTASNQVVLGNSSIVETILRGNVGIGTTSPQRKLHVSNSVGAASTFIAMDNPDTTDTNGTVLSARTTTTGGGAAAFTEFGALSFICDTHNNATLASHMRFYAATSGTNAEVARLAGTGLLTLGVTGTKRGTLALSGNTSGTVTVTPQAAAGTPTLTLPNASGTFAVSATSPLAVDATTGNITTTATVASITPGNGLTSTLTATAPGSAITTSGTLSGAEPINAQTGTTYTVVDGDRAKLVTLSNSGSVAVSLPQAGAASAFQAGWFADFEATTAPLVVITPTTSTIDGATSLALGVGQGVRIVSNGTNYLTARGGAGGRQVLAAARTYYVRTDGSDSNTGFADTSGGAFLTIQKAIDVTAALDVSIYNVTISVGAGTFTTALTLKDPVGAGLVTISGAGATTIISTTSANAVTFTSSYKYALASMKLVTTTTGYTLISAGPALLNLGSSIEFGATAFYHINANFGGVVVCNSNYTISGGGLIHWFADNRSAIIAAGITITLSGTPAFSTRFAGCTNLALLRVNGNTFSGSATGTRYDVSANGVINTAGGGANYLPGDAAGASATGGQYI